MVGEPSEARGSVHSSAFSFLSTNLELSCKLLTFAEMEEAWQITTEDKGVVLCAVQQAAGMFNLALAVSR